MPSSYGQAVAVSVVLGCDPSDAGAFMLGCKLTFTASGCQTHRSNPDSAEEMRREHSHSALRKCTSPGPLCLKVLHHKTGLDALGGENLAGHDGRVWKIWNRTRQWRSLCKQSASEGC